MADLALSSSLIDEYIKYKFNEAFDTNKMRKLLKYIQPFAIRRTHSDFFSDPSTPSQFSDPLVEVIDDCSDDELVQNSRLKLMLIDKIIQPIPLFTTLNILNTYEKLQPKYGATYPNARDKDKAQNHIKALLSDAQWIKITDGYIANTKWRNNKTLIDFLVPHTAIDLIIVGCAGQTKPQITSIEQNALQTIHSGWHVQAQAIQNNIHDRYIETDRVKILLSSGLYHLSTSSQKDFTYIVEIQ